MDAWTWISPLETWFPPGLWTVMKAILILVIAFIVSAIVKILIVKLMKKAPLGRFLRSEDAEATRSFVGKLGYLVVFLLFIPEILRTLEMDSISGPLMGLLNSIWGYLPNVLAAAILLTVGIKISNLIRQLLVPLLEKTKVDKLQEKLGGSFAEKERLSETIAYVAYVLILIPVIIAALNTLEITAISDPAIAMLDTIITFIPNLTVAVILVVLGILIGKIAGQIVERLIAAAGIDQKLATALAGQIPDFSVSKVAGQSVNAVVVIFLVVEAVRVLQLQLLTEIGTTIIAYMPAVLAALCILLSAIVLSAVVSKRLKKYSAVYAAIATTAIMVVCVFFMLSQLGIARTLVNSAFIITISAVAVAFAISFGIGGRKFAANMLSLLESRVKKENAAPSTIQDSED